jgi:5-methyltetrahydrofolate--homocysteine methyltransferase
MKIIGEKINGTRNQVRQAIAARDLVFIQQLAQRQAQADASWLDVNAGTAPAQEPDDLVWLVQTVQAVVDTPLCLDSANPAALRAALAQVRHPPMINSISGEPARLNDILPLVQESGCAVIALAMDERGIPNDTPGRLAVIRKMIDATRRANIADERLYVDPLAMALSAQTDSAQVALATIRAVRAEFPVVHLSAGLSNISFGLPARTLINQAFLTLALDAGLDTAILDPLDHDLKRMLLAAQVVLGQDRYCRNYTRAYRAGLLER